MRLDDAHTAVRSAHSLDEPAGHCLCRRVYEDAMLLSVCVSVNEVRGREIFENERSKSVVCSVRKESVLVCALCSFRKRIQSGGDDAGCRYGRGT